jgi:integrase
VNIVTLRKAADHYLERDGISENTKRTIETSLNEWLNRYTDQSAVPGDVTPKQVRDYIRRETLSSTYQDSLYRRLHAAFNSWIAEGYMRPDDNPMKDARRPKVERTTEAFLIPDEYTSLIRKMEADYNDKVNLDGRTACNTEDIIWMPPPLRFGTATGLPPAEMRKLRAGDVRYDIRCVDEYPLSGETKGAGRQVPPCDMSIRAAKQASIGKEPRDYLFGGVRASQFDTRRLSGRVKHHIGEAKITQRGFLCGHAPHIRFMACDAGLPAACHSGLSGPHGITHDGSIHACPNEGIRRRKC